MNLYTIILPATVFTQHHIIIISSSSHSLLIMKYLEGSLSQCHFVNHNFHILAWDWTQASKVRGQQLTLVTKICPNKVKPLSIVPTCIVFLQVSLISSGPKKSSTLCCEMILEVLFLKVLFSCIRCSEFLTHNISRIIISEKNVLNVM